MGKAKEVDWEPKRECIRQGTVYIGVVNSAIKVANGVSNIANGCGYSAISVVLMQKILWLDKSLYHVNQGRGERRSGTAVSDLYSSSSPAKGSSS